MKKVKKTTDAGKDEMQPPAQVIYANKFKEGAIDETLNKGHQSEVKS